MNLLLRDLGLSKIEIAHCVFDHAIYYSFFKGFPFNFCLTGIKNSCKFPGSEKILGLEDKNFEKLSELECAADVYFTLNIRDEYSKHKSAIYRFFYQHVAAYKSERKAILFEKALECMGEDLKVSSADAGKNSPNTRRVFNIMYIIANAYMGENTITFEHARFLSNLEENAQTSVTAWLKKLSPDPFINFEELIGKPESIYNALKTLCPDKK
jgi:hypothetical protein